MGFWQNKRKRWVSIATGSAVVAAAVVATSVYLSQVPTVRDTLLALNFARDIGALPPRGTGAGQFCGAIGGLGAPEHCYQMQEGSGNLVDYGTGGLTLTAAGTPRYGVAAGVPVQSAGAVAWDEKGIASDGSGMFTGTDTVAAVASYTVVWSAFSWPSDVYLFDWGMLGGSGVGVRVMTTGELRVMADFGTYRSATISGFSATNAVHCATFVFDGATQKAWANGIEYTLDLGGSPGVTTSAQTVALMSTGIATYRFRGAEYRFRLDHSALTLADHQALCGAYTKPLRTNHPEYAASSYTHSGGARCFATTDNTAVCLPGGAAGYGTNTINRWSWIVERSRTNRLLHSTALNNWTVTGNPELLTDGDMESADCASWPSSNGTCTKEAGDPHGGARNYRLTYLATVNPWSGQVPGLTVGTYYRFVGWSRASGAGIQTRFYDGSGGIFCQGISGHTNWNECAGTTRLTYNSMLIQGIGVDVAGEYIEADDLSLTLHGTPTVAPDGSKTAYTLSSTATITTTGTGHANSVAVYPRFWLKCSAGTVTVAHTSGNGNWTIDCTHAALSGKWALIHAKHPAVTITTAWTTTATGTVTPAFSSTDGFSLWMPTITEVDGVSTIPTGAAISTVGANEFAIDNDPAQYWSQTDTLTKTLNELYGSCLSTGPTVRLSGAVGSECEAYWQKLDIQPQSGLDNLWFSASRDLGALPPRGTGAGEWCGEIGGLGAPYHCYVTGGTGNLTDYGTGGITLTKTSTISRGDVPTYLPVSDGNGVSWTSEVTSFQDNSGFWLGTVDLPATRQISVTVLELPTADISRTESVFELQGSADPNSYFLFNRIASEGLRAWVKDGVSGAKGVQVRTTRNGWQCTTVVVDTSGASLGYAYTNGEYSGPFDFQQANPTQFVAGAIRLGGGSQGYMKAGTIARVRVEAYGTKVTLSQHQALCGAYTLPLRVNHPARPDTSWTQTGGARCFATSATTAVCLPGGATGYAWDGAKSAIGWAVEPGRVNRLIQSSALNNWTVTGNPELLTDGDMESADCASWPSSNGTCTKEAGDPHGGARNYRLTYLATVNPWSGQVPGLTVGTYYRFVGWSRASGAGIQTRFYDGSSGIFCLGVVGDTNWNECAGTTRLTYNSLTIQGIGVDVAGEYIEADDLSLTLHGTPAVAPDGSKTAYNLASTATITSATATGYTADATLHPRVWLQCTGAASVTLDNPTSAGEWTVDCSHASLSGDWALIHASHPAVTEVAAWTASAAGEASFRAAGTAAYSLWLPTLTEAAGLSVIPTAAAAVDTGNVAFSVDNDPTKYWASDSTVTETVTEISGDCFVTGSSLLLSGAGGSECTGIWHDLKITNALTIDASKDLGVMPARGTAQGQFCGAADSVGLTAPVHCYQLQEASGNLTDSVGGLTLTAAGTPRYAVTAELPIDDNIGGVDFVTERGIASDGSGRFTGTDTVAAVASVTVAWKAQRHTATHVLFDWGHTGGAGYKAHITNAGVLNVSANLGTARTADVGSFTADTLAINCATFVFNGASTTGWINGTVVSWAWPGAYGTTTSAQTAALLSTSAGASQLQGTVYRHRVDHAALTLAQHRVLCGSYTQAVRAENQAAADIAWTQTGGARAFPTSATTAVVLPGGAAGYGWDLTNTTPEWAIEPNRTNRVLNNSQLNLWTVTGNPELLTDGDMEAAGTGAWTPRSAGSTTLTKDTTPPLKEGAQHLRVARGDGTVSPGAYQTVATVGSYYRFSGWYRSDGTALPNFGAVCGSGNAPCTGTTSTAWQECAGVALATGSSPCAWGSNIAGTYTEYDALSVTLHGTPAVAPDGSKTAYTLASTATITSATATGYTVGAPLYPLLWAKCTTGTVTFANAGGAGEWSIDCTKLNGAWELLHRHHRAVSVVTDWYASSSGTATVSISGADVSIWLPTLTEVEGVSVIPTGAAAVSTGAPVWSFPTIGTKRFWQLGSQLRYGGRDLSGTCLVPSVSSVLLTGDPDCLGYINNIEILR